MQRHGNTFKRTRKDMNRIIEHDDYAEIVLYDGQCNVVGKCKIDKEDIGIVKNHKWRIDISGHVVSNINRKLVFIHRLILRPPIDKFVDHINNQPLDNRKINLRLCTNQENLYNQKIRIDNTSGYKGIHLNNKSGKWQVNINGKYMGRYFDINEAIKVRNDAEEKYHGEFRYKGGIQ